MVTGIHSFIEWFRGYEEYYTIIGGTACDILKPDIHIKIPEPIYSDMNMFIDRMRGENIDLLNLGIMERTKDEILDELSQIYENSSK